MYCLLPDVKVSNSMKSVKMGMILLVVLTVIGDIAALDLEPDLEWDPCKIDSFKLRLFSQVQHEKFLPPSYILENETTTKGCEYFTYRGTLPKSKEEVGYLRIITAVDNPGCAHYPQIPAYVQVLDLSRVGKVNIQANNFHNVSDLKFIRSLVLLASEILSISDDVLGNLSSLECVNLDTYEDFEEDLRGFHKLILLPSLKRVSARHSDFMTIFGSMISQPFNLHSLWLTHNSFLEINDGFSLVFNSFHQLKGLDLRKNYFQVKDLVFTSSDTLESLDLSSNELEIFPPICEKTIWPNLRRLDLSRNKLTELGPWVVKCSEKLYFLDMSRNQIIDVVLDYYLVCFPSIKVLHFDYQYVDDFELIILNDLDVQATKLNSLRELHLENLNQLHFDGELIENSQWTVLKWTPHLQKLYLGGSNLRLIEEQTFLQVFGHLHDLRTLSLPNTKLQFVSAETFSGSVFPNLTELILGDNAITRIPDGCFDSLTQLVHLDLSENKITTVSSLTFSPSLHGRLQAFDLSQNPLTCSCDLMWFRNWFLSDHIKLFKSSAQEYKCHNFPRKILLSDFIVNEQSCLLSRETNSMIIFCCSVLITTFTIFTLLFRYRWHLRLVLYEAFRGRDDVRRRRLEQGNFDHDVFVSYASEDLNWVRQNLMPHLEDRLHLRLCIHDSHFIPGKNIVDNIVDCVEKSKKILMVFTKNFLRSQWCQFELAFCLSHVMEHEDALIVVCVDDVVSCEMTSAMMAVLRTTTYIQWENQADAVRSFWGRLKLALIEVIPDDEHVV